MPLKKHPNFKAACRYDEKKLEPLDSVIKILVIISGLDDPRISPLNTKKEQ